MKTRRFPIAAGHACLTAVLALASFGADSLLAQDVEGRPVFDWDLISLEQNSQRFNGSVLSGFHNMRSPGVTPARAWKAGLGIIYSQEDQIATSSGIEKSFKTQRLIMNPKINYGFYDALEAGLGLEANYVSGKEVVSLPGALQESSEDNANVSAAVVGIKWNFPRMWDRLRLGLSFDSRMAVHRHEFGMLPFSLFNVELDGEWQFTSRFSLVGNLQFITSDNFRQVSGEAVTDLGATYTFSDEFRGLVFGTLQQDNQANAPIFFLGFAGQYVMMRDHSLALAVDFQVNDVRRDVKTEGQIDLEVSYTLTF